MAALSEPDPRGPDPTKPMRVIKPWQVMAFIEQARIRQRHTQRALAQMAGTSQPTYVGWANTGHVRGHHNSHAHMPRLDKVLPLLDALGLDMVIRPRGHVDIVDGPPVKDVSIRLCPMCQDAICTCPELPLSHMLDGNVDPASTPSNINPPTTDDPHGNNAEPPSDHDHAGPCEACKAVGCCEHCWEPG